MSAHQSSGVAHPQRWWNYNIPDKRAQKTGIKETGRIAPEAFTFITNLIHLPLLQWVRETGESLETQMQLNLSENLMRQFLPSHGAAISVTNKTESSSPPCEIWICFISLFRIYMCVLCRGAAMQVIGINPFNFHRNNSYNFYVTYLEDNTSIK